MKSLEERKKSRRLRRLREGGSAAPELDAERQAEADEAAEAEKAAKSKKSSKPEKANNW